MKTTQFTKTSLFESLGIKKDAYFESWERDIHPVLCEVALSAEQIDKLFKDIDQAKGNRTGLGKGIDAVGAAKDKISDIWYNKFGAMLQNSAPVQTFDKSYDDMKAKIRAANPDSKIIAAIDKYGEYAKQHPNMQKFILGIVGSLAAALGVVAAGGIAAGALAVGTGTGVAVGIVNIADRLLKGGEKLSTSLGRGATAGITAGLTAAAVTKVSGLIKDTLANLIKGREVHVITINPGTPMEQKFNLLPADGRAYDKFGQKWLDAVGDTSGGFDGLMDPNSASNSAMTSASKAMEAILDKASDPAYQQAAIDLAQKAGEATAPLKQAIQGITALQQAITPVASALAGQAAGNAQPAQQPAQAESRNLSHKQVLALFERVEHINNRMLTEGRLQEGIWDDVKSGAGKGLQGIKSLAGKAGSVVAKGATAVGGAVAKGAGKALGAVAQGAAKVGHSMTTKVTGSALQKAWEKAGKPTDSAEIEKFLQTQGVNPEVIKTVFQANKIPVTPTAPVGQDAANDPTVDAMPDVMAPGGNRPEQGAMAQGVQQAQGGQQQPAQQQPQQAQGGQPQAQQPQPAQGGQQQPGTGVSKLPDVSKLTPEQKKQLLAQIDQRLASLPAPTQQPQPQAEKPAPPSSPAPTNDAEARQKARDDAITNAVNAEPEQPADLFAEPAATPDLKVSPAPKAGLPTPDEQAKYQEKLKAADQTQNKTTTVGAPTPDEQAKLQAKLKAADQAQNKTKPAPKELAESYKEFKFLVDGIKARI